MFEKPRRIFVLARQLLATGVELAGRLFEVLLLGDQRVQLGFEVVLSLGQPFFRFLQLGPQGVGFLAQLLLTPKVFALGLDFRLFADNLGFALRIGDGSLSLVPRGVQSHPAKPLPKQVSGKKRDDSAQCAG